MYRDLSLLPTGGCIQIVDDKTLDVFIETPTPSHLTYKLINDKYLPVTDREYTPPVDSSVMCYTRESLETLPSPYDFMTPYLHTLAIVSFILIVYGAYRLIIYPFFRRTI